MRSVSFRNGTKSKGFKTCRCRRKCARDSSATTCSGDSFFEINNYTCISTVVATLVLNTCR